MRDERTSSPAERALRSDDADIPVVGDTLDDSRNHHDTSDERITAQCSFKHGIAGESLQTAIDVGQRYVMTM